MYTDNFYTSVDLVTDLFSNGIYCCGTVAENRRGFPLTMKGGKIWARNQERGSMRWRRQGCYLALQWKDNKVVTMLSTIHNANEYVMVKRKTRVAGQWSNLEVKQPSVIETYNKYMNGVDKSDQILSSNNLLRKCVRWWKTLFFHMIDIATVNSFILFQAHRKQFPNQLSLQRPSCYSLLEFREELVREILQLEEFAKPPVATVGKQRDISIYNTDHMVMFSEIKGTVRCAMQRTKRK